MLIVLSWGSVMAKAKNRMVKMQGKSCCSEWTTASSDLVALIDSKCSVISSRVSQIWRRMVSRPCHIVKMERQRREAAHLFLCITSDICTSFVVTTIKMLMDAKTGWNISLLGMLEVWGAVVPTTKMLRREQAMVTEGLINCWRKYFTGMSSHKEAFSFGIEPNGIRRKKSVSIKTLSSQDRCE